MTPPLAVSMGDPSGIGPEIIAKAWAAREKEALSPFFVIGDPRALSAVWDGPIDRIGDPGESVTAFKTALPVLALDGDGNVKPGQPDFAGAQTAVKALELAVGMATAGAASGVVTAPVSKVQLYSAGFTHPGQTEFVAQHCGIAPENAVMMLAGPTLRVVPLTVHIPFADVPVALTQALIVNKGRITARALSRDFGIAQPRLAFAGLNPHAGESGEIGREEIDVMEPAIAQLRAEGIDAIGPFSADTMFHARARAGFDVALCPSHDQALIPVKTLHFDDGVNMTLGLPIVRTSPDHGTAFAIAGRNEAHPGAMIAAIKMAVNAVQRRANATA